MSTARKRQTPEQKPPEGGATPSPAPGAPEPVAPPRGTAQPAGEQGGPTGPEPTRYGDWEKGGRCFDF